MPKLSSEVGGGSLNKKSDVALVQAMLRVIKNPKGQPYVTFGYDGGLTANGSTHNAIKTFQKDHGTTTGPQGDAEGKLSVNGKTFAKMCDLLPASHRDMRALDGVALVYLAGTIAEAQTAAARVNSDTKFTTEFKTKLAQLITNFFQKYGIVLTVNPDWANGGFRTFQEQRELMDKIVDGSPVTQAGPGESNHNWGNGADVGFNNFSWLKGDGSVVRAAGVAGGGDGPWLAELAKVKSDAVAELWKLRNKETTLFPSALAGDKPHLQSFPDSNVSMGNSLAEHLNIEGCMWWSYKQGAYWCNYGLANKNERFKVGTAKKIWDKGVNVDEASLATALNQAEARRKIAALPEYEEAIRVAITELTTPVPAVWKATDIKKAHCNMMREFFRVDWDLSEENYATWKPYDKNGNAM